MRKRWRCLLTLSRHPPQTKINLKTPKSGTATNMTDAWAIAKDINKWPLIIRPAFTLGGTGGGIAYNPEEFEQIVKAGIFASATDQVCISPLF